MERGLGLEERTDRLLLRSQALLSRSPAPPRPCPGPAPSDPLLQWRRRRGVGPGVDTPTGGGASLGSHDPWRSGSQDALRAEGPWGQPSWRSRDCPEAPQQPIRKDSQDALQPPRNLSQEALRPPSPLLRAPWGPDVGQDEAVNDLQQERGDPLLRLLRGRRRELRGRLRAVETLLAALPPDEEGRK